MSRPTVMRTAALATAVTAALIAGPGAGRASAAGCANASAAVASIARTTAASAVRCLVTAERARRGLPTLAPNGHLRAAATAHSRDMVRRGFFHHVSPGGATPVLRVRRAGYSGPTVGEAIGWGTGTLATPAGIVRLLIDSAPHRFVSCTRASARSASASRSARRRTPTPPARSTRSRWGAAEPVR